MDFFGSAFLDRLIRAVSRDVPTAGAAGARCKDGADGFGRVGVTGGVDVPGGGDGRGIDAAGPSGGAVFAILAR